MAGRTRRKPSVAVASRVVLAGMSLTAGLAMVTALALSDQYDDAAADDVVVTSSAVPTVDPVAVVPTTPLPPRRHPRPS